MKRAFAILAVLVIVAAAATAAPLRIFMNPKFTGLSYFQRCALGAGDAAKLLGVQFTYVGSEQPDVQLQVQALENIVSQKADAIICSAIDLNASAPPLRTARSKGIKVVTYDADSAVDSRDFFCNQMDYESAARAELDCALLDSPDGGEIAFIAATPTSPNHMAHFNIASQLVKTDPKYKNLKIVALQFDNDDEAQSVQVATNLMQAFPNLKVIISSATPTVPGACRAIEELGKQGKVFATGVALPSTIKQYLKDGSQKAFFIWDPYWLGYMSMYVAKDAVDGTLKNVVGAKVDCGKAGTFTVGKAGEIVYGKALFFTPQNIDQYNF
jgi:rhamnose transport system substrate-binding protein